MKYHVNVTALFPAKETPAEAEIVSHQLMLRAGLFAPCRCWGLYISTSGLGNQQVEQIIREEMDAIEDEVLLPIVNQPSSGRSRTLNELGRRCSAERSAWALAGLGPTHEEIVTALVAPEYALPPAAPASVSNPEQIQG